MANRNQTKPEPAEMHELDKPIWKYSGIAFGAVVAFFAGSLVESGGGIPYVRYYLPGLFLLIVGLYMYRYRNKPADGSAVKAPKRGGTKTKASAESKAAAESKSATNSKPAARNQGKSNSKRRR
ncbi:hypothetical protein [Heliophilum fasciatum]|uniref:Uncharacterized protein n=1 Tax=Heliophilum fasciatum TaxID=35700 RepID=A0A4R2RQW5_9FIRM|nr:hypothetical protein [Heliophilum fasciatum]MCW2277540.1 hypothetical protein [Heliophilum fasciatum]TCP65169.1 hypothetical protein EDD73_10652 [Heliophilum fasciatum]